MLLIPRRAHIGRQLSGVSYPSFLLSLTADVSLAEELTMSADGVSILAPPNWLCEHPEIKRRGIKLEIPLKPVGIELKSAVNVLSHGCISIVHGEQTGAYHRSSMPSNSFLLNVKRWSRNERKNGCHVE